MNDDVQPLNFRSEHMQNGDKDPYFGAAPAWSTLSGGRNPTHTCTPAQLCEWLLEAIKCVEAKARLGRGRVAADGRAQQARLRRPQARDQVSGKKGSAWERARPVRV